MVKFNPFTPDSPAHKEMFSGRSFELETFDSALTQTKHSNPTHLLLLGESKIGKTSFLNIAQMFARSEFQRNDQSHNFLTVRVQLDENTSLADFALNLKKAIKRQINIDNPELTWFKDSWDFLTKFEAGAISYKREPSNSNNAQLIQDFIYSLIYTVKALKDSKITKNKDGLIIFLDEADKAPKELHLGAFLKKLSESLISKGYNNILFILSGLPNLRKVLIESHESSLGLFQELNLQPLTKAETSEVILKGLKEAEKRVHKKTEIDQAAQELIYMYSEGHPHFVQQIGYCAFEIDTDNKIDNDDVKNGFIGEHGALERDFRKSAW